MKISFVELENYYPIKIAKWLENVFRWFESVYRPEIPEMYLQNFEKLQRRKKYKRFHSVCAKRNFIGRSPHHLQLVATSFEATPQPRSFVPRKAAMMFSLRSKCRRLFLCLQQVSIWFSIVRICPLKRWSYFVFTFCIAFESMW